MDMALWGGQKPESQKSEPKSPGYRAQDAGHSPPNCRPPVRGSCGIRPRRDPPAGKLPAATKADIVVLVVGVVVVAIGHAQIVRVVVLPAPKQAAQLVQSTGKVLILTEAVELQVPAQTVVSLQPLQVKVRVLEGLSPATDLCRPDQTIVEVQDRILDPPGHHEALVLGEFLRVVKHPPQRLEALYEDR